MDNIQLVTLAQAKAHLRVDNDAEDADLLMKIEGASGIVLDYLKLATVPASWGIDTGGSDDDQIETGDQPREGVPRLVQMAVLAVLGELYKNRESSKLDALPEGVERLLRRLRDPSLA